MKNTRVKELMTKKPTFIEPDATLQEAAELMRDIDCGALPVGDDDTVKGIITDRDMIIRAVAKGKDMETERVADYMTEKVFFCEEQDTLEQAADLMREHQVSRLLVKGQSGEITGYLSFGCIMRRNRNMEEISHVVEHALGKKAA